jgi:hypothetical protein
MATSDKYKRGSSGYSMADEKNAKKYGEMTRTQYQNLVNEEQAKGRKIDSNLPMSARKRATQNYLDNESSSQGRADNRSNMEFGQSEVNKIYEANSRAQYQHEKEVGDPSARDMTYEEWKKL